MSEPVKTGWCPCCLKPDSLACECSEVDRRDFGLARDFLNDSASPKVTCREERAGLVVLLRRVRTEEREACVNLLRELAEDARDDGDGSDDELSVALDDAADALRSRGAS